MNIICKRCQIEKSINEFGNDKNSKYGKKIYCRECELKRGREYREKNREKINQFAKDYRKNNPKKYQETIKKYLEKNPHMTSKERSKKYREKEEWRQKFKESRDKWVLNNIDKIREQRKEYYLNNKKKERLINNNWKKNKSKTDGFFRMKKNLRNRIREYLTGNSKSKRTKEIVGLDKLEFKLYIENKFTNGMTWDNYGEWHLDHIIPLCKANNNEEALLLNHYTNLQPLWAEDNIKKNRKLWKNY
jgi:hypothetical protein